MTSKKVLLTGFEPFGGASFNPSGAVVQEIQSKESMGLKLLPQSCRLNLRDQQQYWLI